MTHANKKIELEPDAADWWSRPRPTPEHIKRRAAAEWAAMDAEGRLPEGWTYQENEQ